MWWSCIGKDAAEMLGQDEARQGKRPDGVRHDERRQDCIIMMIGGSVEVR